MRTFLAWSPAVPPQNSVHILRDVCHLSCSLHSPYWCHSGFFLGSGRKPLQQPFLCGFFSLKLRGFGDGAAWTIVEKGRRESLVFFRILERHNVTESKSARSVKGKKKSTKYIKEKERERERKEGLRKRCREDKNKAGCFFHHCPCYWSLGKVVFIASCYSWPHYWLYFIIMCFRLFTYFLFFPNSLHPLYVTLLIFFSFVKLLEYVLSFLPVISVCSEDSPRLTGRSLHTVSLHAFCPPPCRGGDGGAPSSDGNRRLLLYWWKTWWCNRVWLILFLLPLVDCAFCFLVWCNRLNILLYHLASVR